MNRLLLTKLVLTGFTGFGAAGFVFRFWKGIGPSTNLSDYIPWGLWVGLDVMAGVAMAAGGLVLAVAVHIFRLEKFRPFLRAVILTAMLGYAVEPVGLLLDLGLPWHMWHPLIFWQYRSFLFWIALCVMAYFGVLAIQFIPVVLEHPLLNTPVLQKIRKLLNKLYLPVIIIGIFIATAHQSALGSLFLVMPHRTHPLWHSPLISIHFLISATGLGMAMILFESTVTSYLYRRKPKLALLATLGRATSIVLMSYAVIRIGDLAYRDKLHLVFDGSWQSFMFMAEMLVSALLPAALFNMKTIRSRVSGIFFCALLVIAGLILNRLNVSIITFLRPEGVSYFPSLLEISTSLALFSLAFLVFLFFVEHVNLFDGEVYYMPGREREEPQAAGPAFTLPLRIAGPVSPLSLVFVLSTALGFATFHSTTHPETRRDEFPVQKPAAGPNHGELRINNGDTSIYVIFNHQFHEDTLGKDGSCLLCHHMNFAQDTIAACYGCHRDMYGATSIFDHPKHEKHFSGKKSCKACHPNERTGRTHRPCKDCHPAMFPEQLAGNPSVWTAPAYVDAMHKQCIDCHLKKWRSAESPNPEYCHTCHKNRGKETGAPAGRISLLRD